MDLQGHYHVMNRMSKEELFKLSGGGVEYFTASFLNAIAKCADALLDVGRAIGSAIRRITSKNMC